MAFVAANLRIVLLSTHVPLVEAIGCRARSHNSNINLTQRELRRWVLTVLVGCCGAESPTGQKGLFGVEEASEMVPAFEACRVMTSMFKARSRRHSFSARVAWRV